MLNKFNNKKTENRVVANRSIRFEKLRVHLPDGGSEIMSKNQALSVAEKLNLDLILIAEKAEPPVCKSVELNKFLYEKKQSEKAAKKRQRENAVELKEIRLGINIETHDLETKAKHAEKFLAKGNVVTLTVILRGRERAKHDLAVAILNKFADMVDAKLEKINRSGNRVSSRIIQK